jgi:hypothetical protein
MYDQHLLKGAPVFKRKQLQNRETATNQKKTHKKAKERKEAQRNENTTHMTRTQPGKPTLNSTITDV